MKQSRHIPRHSLYTSYSYIGGGLRVNVDIIYIHTWTPQKTYFFLVRAIFRRSSKNPHNKQFWCRFLSLLRCFFVTSASFWRHVFYREFAACFCVMFSGETKKDIVSGSRYIPCDSNNHCIYIYIVFLPKEPGYYKTSI